MTTAIQNTVPQRRVSSYHITIHKPEAVLLVIFFGLAAAAASVGWVRLVALYW